MRVLMLGNSYIFTNDLPSMLAQALQAEVVHHTRGGARLAEQLNPQTEMGAKTAQALETESWDYVILQEMSNGPVVAKESFLRSAVELCEKIRTVGAVPVFYLTWAYQEGSQALTNAGLDYDEMYWELQAAYREAAATGEALLADVGTAFYEKRNTENLYAPDGSHPNEAGSHLAAEILARTILENEQKGNG